VGIGIELLIQFINGVPLGSLFRANAEVRQLDERTWLICPRDAAIFSNWIAIRRRIERYGLAQNMNIIVDLSNTRLVDHTVMEKLRELEREFEQRGIALAVVGLDDHMSFSHHPAAARLRGVHRSAPQEELSELAAH
jgi:MFS superfamily sulfate permease-like transporter